jgi:uncharacterized protein
MRSSCKPQCGSVFVLRRTSDVPHPAFAVAECVAARPYPLLHQHANKAAQSHPPRRRSHQPRRSRPRALLDPAVACVLSHSEAAALLRLRAGSENPPAPSSSDMQPQYDAPGPWSINLGRDALASVRLCNGGLVLVPPPPQWTSGSSTVSLKQGPQVTFKELAKMAKKQRVGAYECFFDGETPPQKIAAISDTTQRTASLQPLVDGKPPTVVLGGFGMHRFKGTDPAADTHSKIRALGHAAAYGHVLDVCTGLGYTAIALADIPTVTAVTTIELDQVMVDMQQRNPWSERLFVDPKINRIVADAVNALPDLPSDMFRAVVHDPPAQAMAGELYSESFYSQLARVLAPDGKLFHYIGDPSSSESGRLYKGIVHRLLHAGFSRVQEAPGAFGLTAYASKYN